MSELLLERGNQVVTLDELALIPTPDPTRTYQPITHHGFSLSMKTISRDTLNDYEFVNEQYGVATYNGYIEFPAGDNIGALNSFK